MPSPFTRAGFTLVELLVVVALIALLLALLTPALDQAIYQAELTSCGARLDTVGSSLATGAMQNQRRYPSRTAGVIDWMNITLASSNGDRDDRPALRKYLQYPLPALVNCPLQKPIDFDRAQPTASIDLGYNLFYGSRIPGEQNVQRVGDRFTWTDPATGTQHSFALLAMDYLMHSDYYYSSHPDKAGYLAQGFWQFESGWVGWDSNGLPMDGGRYISSWWSGTSTGTLGRMDLNAAYSDGAVVRYADVERDDLDERMTTGPYNAYGDHTPLYWTLLPLR